MTTLAIPINGFVQKKANSLVKRKDYRGVTVEEGTLALHHYGQI